MRRGRGIILFSLPKSGSSWLEQILYLYYQFPYITFPSTTVKEVFSGGSHTFPATKKQLRFAATRQCIFKNHHIYSREYDSSLDRYDMIPIVLTRNILNVIKSHITYVRKTPYHPEYSIYHSRSDAEGVDYFINHSLHEWIHWTRTWDSCEYPIIRVEYETLRKDPYSTSYQIISKLDGEVNEDLLRSAITSTDTQRMKSNKVSFFNEGRIDPDRSFFSDLQIERIENYE
jgi:hypothetical protein